MLTLIDDRTDDGSRHFARLPRRADWKDVCRHIALLKDATIINFVAEAAPRPWIDFAYRGHRFAIHHRGEHLDLLVENPLCCDMLLFHVGSHFSEL